MTTDDTRPLPSGEEAFDAAIQRAFADTGKAVRTTFTPQDDDLKFQTDLAYARGFKAGHEAAAPTPDPLPAERPCDCTPGYPHNVKVEPTPDPLREALEKARLVSQWHGSLMSGPMEVLDAELGELGDLVRAALAGKGGE